MQVLWTMNFCFIALDLPHHNHETGIYVYFVLQVWEDTKQSCTPMKALYRDLLWSQSATYRKMLERAPFKYIEDPNFVSANRSDPCDAYCLTPSVTTGELLTSLSSDVITSDMHEGSPRPTRRPRPHRPFKRWHSNIRERALGQQSSYILSNYMEDMRRANRGSETDDKRADLEEGQHFPVMKKDEEHQTVSGRRYVRHDQIFSGNHRLSYASPKLHVCKERFHLNFTSDDDVSSNAITKGPTNLSVRKTTITSVSQISLRTQNLQESPVSQVTPVPQVSEVSQEFEVSQVSAVSEVSTVSEVSKISQGFPTSRESPASHISYKLTPLEMKLKAARELQDEIHQKYLEMKSQSSGNDELNEKREDTTINEQHADKITESQNNSGVNIEDIVTIPNGKREKRVSSKAGSHFSSRRTKTSIKYAKTSNNNNNNNSNENINDSNNNRNGYGTRLGRNDEQNTGPCDLSMFIFDEGNSCKDRVTTGLNQLLAAAVYCQDEEVTARVVDCLLATFQLSSDVEVLSIVLKHIEVLWQALIPEIIQSDIYMILCDLTMRFEFKSEIQTRAICHLIRLSQVCNIHEVKKLTFSICEREAN